MARVCLNMIVKNEEARIGRCLFSLVSHVDCWSILDTGSTDGTRETIRAITAVAGRPGHLGETTFTNFRDTRNEALDHARRLRGDLAWDYLLFCDADMELVAPKGLGELTAPGYQMLQRSGNMEYWNARIVRWDNECRYVTPTHEYLSTAQTLERLIGPYFLDHADGANRPGKVERDIALLKAELEVNPDDQRCWFYLGNSYKDIGRHADAVEAYMRRAELGGWEEEVYVSLLYASRSARAMDG